MDKVLIEYSRNPGSNASIAWGLKVKSRFWTDDIPWPSRVAMIMHVFIHPDIHFGSLVQCPDGVEIWHNSAGIPAVPFKEPLPAYSPEHTTYYFWFVRNNAMNAMETIDREPCICIE
jgi:hypothetical protein